MSPDDVIGDALEPVLRDLDRTMISRPRIEVTSDSREPDWPSVMLWSPDGSGVGVRVSCLASEAERIASVADQVQEWAIEELWSRGPTNWPPCPHHPETHPMSAVVQDGAAVWVCPVDGFVACRIGAAEAVGRP